MKTRIIFLAAFIILSSVGAAYSQTLATRATLSKSIDSTGRETATITYTGLENPNLEVFEAVVETQASTCAGHRNISSVRLADPTVASLSYDPIKSLYILRWTPRADAGGCNVILVTDGDETVNASDLAIWRTNFGAGSFAADLGEKHSDEFEMGSLRTTGSGTAFKVVVDPTPSIMRNH
jgi:hypothetical protein